MAYSVSTIDATKNALIALSNTEGYSPTITLKELTLKPDQLSRLTVGKGGSKKAIDIGNSEVILLRNLDADKAHPDYNENAESLAINWLDMIQDELRWSKAVNQAGVLTSSLERTIGQVKYKSGLFKSDVSDLPLLRAKSFQSMEVEGIQVRDHKNPRESLFGNSMIFGCSENILEQDYLRQVLETLKPDMIALLTHGIQLGGDSVNLAIVDTDQTPTYKHEEIAHYQQRKQNLRLFCFDFSSKHGPVERDIGLFNEEGEINEKEIQKQAAYLLQYAFNAVQGGIKEEEQDALLSSGAIPNSYAIYRKLEEHFKQFRLTLSNEIATEVCEQLKARQKWLPRIEDQKLDKTNTIEL